jgi:hypothetical protein
MFLLLLLTFRVLFFQLLHWLPLCHILLRAVFLGFQCLLTPIRLMALLDLLVRLHTLYLILRLELRLFNYLYLQALVLYLEFQILLVYSHPLQRLLLETWFLFRVLKLLLDWRLLQAEVEILHLLWRARLRIRHFHWYLFLQSIYLIGRLHWWARNLPVLQRILWQFLHLVLRSGTLRMILGLLLFRWPRMLR